MVSAEYADQASGGIGTHIYCLSRELARRGHEVHLVTSVRRPPAMPPAPGMTLHLIPFFSGLLVRNFFWTAASRLAMRKPELRRADIVHAHAPVCSLYPFVHKRSVPLATTFHTLFYKFREVPQVDRGGVLLARVGEFSDRLALNSSDVVMACSNSIRDEILQDGFPPDRLLVVPNGVPMEDYSTPRPEAELEDLRRRYRLPATERLILTVGVLIPRKGIDLLIEAVRRLDAVSPGVHGLIIVGDGPDRERLVQLSKDLEARVAFTGRIPLEDLKRMYQVADLFAMPSHYEGLPTVVLEALSSARPVVGSNIPSLHGLLEGCGRLVERTPEAFATAIEELLADDQRVRRMRAAALEAVRPYSWQRLAATVEKGYESAMAPGG